MITLRKLCIISGFFPQKVNDLKRQASTISLFTQLQTRVLLKSYQVAHKIDKCKNPHTIAEDQQVLAGINHVNAMIGGAAQQLNLVPLSDDITCRMLSGMAEDIHDQLTDQMKQRILSAIR